MRLTKPLAAAAAAAVLLAGAGTALALHGTFPARWAWSRCSRFRRRRVRLQATQPR
ncbi:hypothetical protein [Paenibacillus sp. P22]|uniref:hypothetical protein n=1 Tax=Paenibacillus sp. P22 TaxID=483908 RepID=UPI001E38EF72|nr:hypothetical protein [Paenibacillus sp. P22]